MLKNKYFNNGSSLLLISFAPSSSNGKFLFFKANTIHSIDTLFFCDTSDRFYLKCYFQVKKLIEKCIQKKSYEKIVFVGFSAGAFVAARIASDLDTVAKKIVFSFSPHTVLHNKYSTVWQAIEDKRILKDLDLQSFVRSAGKEVDFNFFFPIHSGKDATHVADSLNFNLGHSIVHYISYSHNTFELLKTESYPESLLSMFTGEYHCKKEFQANASEISDCVQMADAYMAELDEKISRYQPRSLSPEEFSAEFCYWWGRQFFRRGELSSGLQWINSAILKSIPNVPDHYFETLGNFCFSIGNTKEAFVAYSNISVPNAWQQERLESLSALLHKGAKFA